MVSSLSRERLRDIAVFGGDLNDGVEMASALLSLSTPTHRHKKRGTEYVLIGYGKMQAESWFERNRGGNTFNDVDMREVAIYRSVDDGSLWVRPREEFEDGRFEAIGA